MVQERRGMLRVWNVSLVIVTFFLTIFGTFMTRSGIVQSVHAFGEDRELALMFTIFMVALLVFSFGYVIYRLPLLRARHELDSWMSKEAAFLANNWVLLFSAFFVLFATMFPTISEALMNERLTVGPPFFNKWMAPVGLILLFLTGVGPLLAWRKSTVRNLREQFLFPTVFALVVAGTLVALGVRVWSSGICFALSAFVFGTISQEFWRGARVRQGGTGTDVFTALIGLIGRSRRRYGGYIVHLGIVLMFLGFAGEGFKSEEQVLMKPAQETTLRGYTFRYDALRVTDDGQKQMITGHVALFRDGRQVAELHPAKHFFRKREQEPTTEVAIRRGFGEDVYVVLAGYDMQTQSATLLIVVNPLVNWIWAGFAIMAIGTGIALLPESTFAFAAARAPAGSVTATLLILALLMPASLARAQTPQSVMPEPKTELRKQLEGDIMCSCGCRAPMNDCQMGPTCHGLQEQNAKMDKFLAAGMDRDAVRAAFVADAGSQAVLMEPLDEGFNRLAWLLPYVFGVFGLAVVVVVARRWSRTSGEDRGDDLLPAPTRTEADDSLSTRLDDELRDLD
jgi:cytochrome c-type biogenesis protein CcmF